MEPFASYVLETFRNLYQVPEEVNIFYGNDDKENISRGVWVSSKAGNFFRSSNKLDHGDIIFKEWKGVLLPFLFDDSLSRDLIEERSGKAVISYDIVAASFYFLSGWQEYVAPYKDIYGRFRYQDSIQNKLNSPHIPFVNYYFDILKSAVEQTYSLTLTIDRSLGKFALAITHDIDTLFSGWLEEGFDALKKAKLSSLFSIAGNRIVGKDPWFNLKEIRAIEKKWNANGSYYFLTQQGSCNGIKHADYATTDPRITKVINYLIHSGAEVGIHGSVGSHVSAKLLKKEKRKIGTELVGGRFHFLSFDIYTTPNVLELAGIAYDSTLGFAEHIGFRNGFAHPFYLYDLSQNGRTNVLEIPLVIMDTTLQKNQYMGVQPDQVFHRLLPILEELRKFNGVSAILWHNSYFSDFKYAGWDKVFTDILDYCHKERGSAVAASEIIPHYEF